MKFALRMRDVSIRHEHGADPVLSSISLSIGEGERVALVGLNGTGKTSLLMAAAGLVHHDGEIEVCGELLTGRSAPGIRKRIGFLFNVPEDQLLFPVVAEDVAFGPLRAGLSRAEAMRRAERMLGAMGIPELASTPLHHLSHGQKLRVALAGSLATEPPLLLLDEPSAGLDPPGARELARLLSGTGSAQLIATHDLEFAGMVCSRVLLLENGGICPESGSLTPGKVGLRWLGE